MEGKVLIEATCPDCRGPLSEVRQGEDLYEYRCLVGHAYSPRALLQLHSETQENALWAAVLALEEGAGIAQRLAPQFPPDIAAGLTARAEEKLRQAQAVRKVIEQLEPFQTE